MEKLRPILEQKFWVLSGVALLLVVTGWWMGTGSLAAEYTKRETILKNLNASTGHSPNDAINSKMKIITDVKEKRLEETSQYLKKEQQGSGVETWHRKMVGYIKGKKFLDDLKIEARETYKEYYRKRKRKGSMSILENMWKIARPFDIETGEGQCDVAIETLPQVPEDQWGLIAPSSEEVWYAQQDVSLVSALLKAIAGTNGEAEGIVKAPVKSIVKLELYAGKRKPDGTPDNGQTEDSQEGADAAPQPGTTAGLGRSEGETMGRTTSGSGTGLAIESVDFPAENEFGIPETPQGEGQPEGTPQTNPVPGSTDVKNEETLPKVYIDDDPKMPYKTRGFYMKVVMDRTKIPELLVQLENMKYPVEIVRVHQASLKGTYTRGTQNSLQTRTSQPVEGISPFGRSSVEREPGRREFSSLPGTSIVQKSTIEETAQVTYKQAMKNPRLSEVVIAGIMYIYTQESKDKDKKNEDKK
ncbi:hypothetical protein MNBD_PLANCTO02-1907 [hydrothermal vent metagenome]|uniref:Uncharacterized protein n=1 Tax=hydrothermal vent metagenome TaxID=652676 RepID=A0A3B1E342_9ZZZZ